MAQSKTPKTVKPNNKRQAAPAQLVAKSAPVQTEEEEDEEPGSRTKPG